jgi:hypothetical protein
MERHRQGGGSGCAPYLPAIAIDARGHIDRENRNLARCQPFDERARFAIEISA